MSVITQMTQEKGVAVDTLCNSLAFPRATYYRHQHIKQGSPDTPRSKPPQNALSSEERQRVLDILHSERFIDKTPYEAFNALIDTGEYHCSPRTMYRVLEAQEETVDRRQQRNHRDAIKPELIATKPNEVWSWDITKLLGQQKWQYYYLYVILDIFSRYVVGWMVADSESQLLASRLIQETALKQGIQRSQLTLHADRGASMTSHSVAKLLEHLGIAKTHSRPYTSDDNPFSESHFKTMKYRPDFPVRFSSLEVSEVYGKKFFPWYNKEHYHAGIKWLTPHSVHYGQAEDILKNRHTVLMQAYAKNPIRFGNKEPKLKELPAAVYINPPQTIQINYGQKEIMLAG
jgi:putative transposase